MPTSSQPSTVSTETSGLLPQALHSTTTSLISHRKMAQPRRSMSMSSRLSLLPPKVTGRAQRLVSELLTRSTCLSSTTQRTTLHTSDARAAVALALLELHSVLLSEYGTRLVRCQTESSRTQACAMSSLRTWESILPLVDIECELDGSVLDILSILLI